MRSCIGALDDYIPATFAGPPWRPLSMFQECSMFVTPAFAQTGGGFSALGPAFDLVVPFVMIFVVMYFFMIRPRQQQLKKHQDMLAAVRRGDTVITGGGLIGKVTKVIDDKELEIDLGGGTKVTALRSTLSEVRVKGEPVANQNAKK
jgi:preprotein translocase subunit YajC